MGSVTSSDKRSKKKHNKLIAFHYYKNKLRMIMKNQFGISFIFSVFVCLFDICGTGIRWLLTGEKDNIPILAKALIWNLRNFKGTLQNRIRFKNESADFHKLFLPYSGVWKTKNTFL